MTSQRLVRWGGSTTQPMKESIASVREGRAKGPLMRTKPYNEQIQPVPEVRKKKKQKTEG